MGGYDDGTYRPGNPVTRGQFAKIIVLALGRQPLDAAPRVPSFVDVPYTGLLYPFAYVETAADLGIIQGYDDGTFRPGERVTRAQLALMLVRAGGSRLADLPRATPTGSPTCPSSRPRRCGSRGTTVCSRV